MCVFIWDLYLCHKFDGHTITTLTVWMGSGRLSSYRKVLAIYLLTIAIHVLLHLFTHSLTHLFNGLPTSYPTNYCITHKITDLFHY